MDMNVLLSSPCFVLLDKLSQPVKLILGDYDLVLVEDKEPARSTKAIKIKYRDVVGLALKKVGNEPVHCYIEIQFMPIVKHMFRSKSDRRWSNVKFQLNPHFQPAEKIEEFLQYTKSQIESYVYSDKEPEFQRFRKPVLLLVNPASGKGNALSLLKERVLPLLNSVEVTYEVIQTAYAGHASQIISKLDLSLYYGVVIVSGDGLLYEVMQALMSREDHEEAIKMPLGILPAGSGNGLCCSINHAAGESFKSELLTHSLYVLMRHQIKPLDLVKLDTVDGTLYSFLSVNIGMMADIDIESERFRSLGNARFTVEAITKIIKPRSFNGCVYFKPIRNYVYKGRCKTDADVHINGTQEIDESNRMRSVSMPISGLTGSDAHEQNGTDQINLEDRQGKTTPSQILPPQTVQEALDGDGPIVLPLLSEEPPADWIKIEDNFHIVLISHLALIGPELMMAPEASMNDGLMYLVMIRAPMKRMRMLHVMGQLADGSHTRNPDVELIPIRAFRIVPSQTKGNLVVDGEKVAYGPIQGQVLPGKARLMAM